MTSKTIKNILKLFNLFRHFSCLIPLFKGVAAGIEHKNILVTLKCNLVVDIGANKGQFALVSRLCFPEATIISFEPLSKPSTKFLNIFKRDTNVFLQRVAIGNKSGCTTIHVTAENDSSSLLPISKLQTQLFPGTEEIGIEIIKIGRLNEFLSIDDIISPAMLKLDVQGYELDALRGCEAMLNRFSYVYVECSFVELYSDQALADDIIAWLSGRGWCLSGIYNMNYDSKGRSIQADFLFEKSNRLQNK